LNPPVTDERLTAPDGYEISTDPARLDAALVHRWLSQDSYWAMGRPRDKHDRAVAGSLNFGAYRTGSGLQVAYARVVTDYATFGWLCDVYVDRAVRGQGLGTALVTAVRDHLAPCGLRRLLLATNDAHGVYAKLGFAPLASPEKWMTLGEQLFLPGKTPPGRLPGHAQALADPRPRRPQRPGPPHPAGQVRLDLVTRSRDPRQALQHLLHGARVFPGRQLRRRVGRALHQQRAQRHAAIADEHPGPGHQPLHLGTGLQAERARRLHGLPSRSGHHDLLVSLRLTPSGDA
jgi:GNAT superfamily N-acetyltransferase